MTATLQGIVTAQRFAAGSVDVQKDVTWRPWRTDRLWSPDTATLSPFRHCGPNELSSIVRSAAALLRLHVQPVRAAHRGLSTSRRSVCDSDGISLKCAFREDSSLTLSSL
jgi:hypothetical protein